MPYIEWIDGQPVERLTPEERKQKKEEAKQKKREKKKRTPGEIPKYTKGRKEGMDLENRVTERWNNAGKKEKKNYNVKEKLSFTDLLDEEDEEEESSEEEYTAPVFHESPKRSYTPHYEKKAQRQPNSGALWHAKGDVTLSHALMEVKERGTTNSRGEKTISIPKSWLTKQEEEAFQERRDFWYLAFAYKNDDSIYIIKDYDHEIEMVNELEQLREENQQLKERLEKDA